ncbi:MAG: manganese/zinc/iron transport system permease protein [Verrucomicrobiales bacterium]|jgi:manganese/zinc/iron transport system permease protein
MSFLDAIPAFSFEESVLFPWKYLYWVPVLGFLVTLCCGLVGNFLLLRRMSLVGDAISHSVLPGIVLAYLMFQTLTGLPVFLGALIAGLLATALMEAIHRSSRIKQDAAIGIVFSAFFALGVILVRGSDHAENVDLDVECILFGELGQVGLSLDAIPFRIIQMTGLALLVVALIVAFYKELVVTAFDPALARSLGIHPTIAHYALISAVTAVIVASLEAVGSILVIAVLIVPGATASLLSTRLPVILWLTVVHSLLSAALGFQLGNLLNCRYGAALVTAGMGLFVLAWLFSPSQGMVALLLRRIRRPTEPITGPIEPAVES